jgi:hypothetical protein
LARAGTATNGTLYFDTFQVKNPLTSQLFDDATVQSIVYNYDGGTLAGSFSLSGQSLIKDLGASGNADGLIFSPTGTLLIGGSTTTNIVEINTGGTTLNTKSVTGTNPYHLSLSPDGTTVYSGGSTTLSGGDSPGPLGVTGYPLNSNGTFHTPTGDDTGITQLAFDASGNAYYTSSTFSGSGTFGTINLTTFVTSRKLGGTTALPAAHGITYDSFTHDLILAGDSHITQVDPTTFAIVSDLDLTGLINAPLDQVGVDGHGHVFASSNGNVSVFNGTGTTGQLVFIDMTGGTHTLTDAGNYRSIQNLAFALDDIAPLSGPGSIPEPAGGMVVGLAGVMLVRRRQLQLAPHLFGAASLRTRLRR